MDGIGLAGRYSLSTGKDRSVAAFDLYRQAGNRLSSSRVLPSKPNHKLTL